MSEQTLTPSRWHFSQIGLRSGTPQCLHHHSGLVTPVSWLEASCVIVSDWRAGRTEARFGTRGYSARTAKVKPVAVTWNSGNLVIARQRAGKRGLAQGWVSLQEQERRMVREEEPGLARVLLQEQERWPLRRL
jgi:hypothetical protein